MKMIAMRYLFLLVALIAGQAHATAVYNSGGAAAALLRSDLANPSQGKGVDLVFGAERSYSVTTYGGKPDNASDALGPFRAAKFAANGARIRFPVVPGTANVYRFNPPSIGDLQNAVLDVDTGVTLSLPNNTPYQLFAGITVVRPTRFVFRDINVAYTLDPQPTATRKTGRMNLGDLLQKSVTSVAGNSPDLHGRTVVWPTADTFADRAANASDFISTTFSNITQGNFTGGFVEIGIDETISTMFTATTAQASHGVIIRGTNGFAVYYRDPAAVGQNLYRAYKAIGQPLVQSQDAGFPGSGGAYPTFEPGGALWSVQRISDKEYVVALNNRPITGPFGQNVGQVLEIGFVHYTNTANTNFTIGDIIVERNSNPTGMQPIKEIRLFGDSTVADWPGGISDQLKDLLDGSFGLRAESITNFGVVGNNVAQTYALMQQVGLGNAYYVPIVVGTNDIQGIGNLATFVTNVGSMLDYVRAAGRVPILVLPWTWYRQSEAGGTGQGAQNPQARAAYISKMLRAASDRNLPVVNIGKDLPYPDPAYRTTQASPLLRDNIHQDQLGYQLYTEAIAQAIASHYLARPNQLTLNLPSEYVMLPGSVQAYLNVSQSRDGQRSLSAQLSFPSTPAVNATMMRVPRFMKPPRVVQTPVLCFNAGVPSVGHADIGTDGLVILRSRAIGCTTFTFAAFWE